MEMPKIVASLARASKGLAVAGLRTVASWFLFGVGALLALACLRLLEVWIP